MSTTTETPSAPVPKRGKAETITDQLFKRADEELRNRINSAINIQPLNAALGCSFHDGSWVQVAGVNINGCGTFSGWAPDVVDSAKSAVFAALRDANRTKYVKAFVDKVADVSAMVEELNSR